MKYVFALVALLFSLTCGPVTAAAPTTAPTTATTAVAVRSAVSSAVSKVTSSDPCLCEQTRDEARYVMLNVLGFDDQDAAFILEHSYYYYYVAGNQYGMAALEAAAEVQGKLPYGNCGILKSY